jgi:hypothetical protein
MDFEWKKKINKTWFHPLIDHIHMLRIVTNGPSINILKFIFNEVYLKYVIWVVG